jgi:hypothetical protein
MMAGTTAASPGIRSSHELGAALEAEGRDLLAHLAALTMGTLDLQFGIEDNLLEIALAALAIIFKDRHDKSPFLL